MRTGWPKRNAVSSAKRKTIPNKVDPQKCFSMASQHYYGDRERPFSSHLFFLPVADYGVGWSLILVTTALLLAASAGKGKKYQI